MKTIILNGVEYNLTPVSDGPVKKEEVKQEKYDNLRKLIGRNSDSLCIFGERVLKSMLFPFTTSIEYTNFNRELYIAPVSFEETTLGELEYGDVFVLYDYKDTEDYRKVKVFMGKDEELDFLTQNLSDCAGVEIIDNGYISEDEEKSLKVIKALRQ